MPESLKMPQETEGELETNAYSVWFCKSLLALDVISLNPRRCQTLGKLVIIT